MSKILVTGGAGYIGSHTLIELMDGGYDVISIDNFSKSYKQSLEGIRKITGRDIKNYEVDLKDYEEVEKIFMENQLDGIIHFAAYKAVGESVENPMLYYENNLNSLINLLKCVRKFNIKTFLFSSSCSVYGNPDRLPVTEQTPLKSAESPYGASKQMGERIIADFEKVNSCLCMNLRYFNPVGAHPSGLIGEHSPDIPNNLLPIITETASGIREKMYIWGDDYPTKDGTCIRDYIHVCDIASAHKLSMDYLLRADRKLYEKTLNLGSGEGVSVAEVIHSFEKVTGVKLHYEIGPRREGDVISIYADNQLARDVLGWSIKFSVDDMLRSAWKWQQNLNAVRE